MFIFRIFLFFVLILPVACRPLMKASTDRVLKTSEGYAPTSDGVRLFYRLVGSGPDTVIVIHGGPGFTMNYFLEDLSPLSKNHALLFYDQRGSGRSTLVSDSVSLNAQLFSEDLNAIRDHFSLNKLTLLGHSWGTGVVALYSAKYPERVAKIIAVGVLPLQRYQLTEAFQRMAASRDTSTVRRMRELRTARLAQPENSELCREYYVLWFEKFFGDPTAAARSKGDFCAGSTESRRNSMNSVGRFTMASLGDWDWRVTLSSVSAPVLIVHGMLDPLPSVGAQAWTAALPQARLLLLEGIGHFPYLEAPDRFFREVDQFLRER